MRSIKHILLTFLLSTWGSVSALPLLNMDFGHDFGGPGLPDTYGAASGQIGTWNKVNTLGLTGGLLDISGAASGASVNVFGDGWSTGGFYVTDDEKLLSDGLFRTGGNWSMTFSGLDNGIYDIYYYAPQHAMDSGDITINGTFVPYLLGNINTLVQGASWDMLSGVAVTSGTLSLRSGLPNTIQPYTGIAGIQIVQASNQVPEPGTLLLLCLGLTGFGLFHHRRQK
jgi:hypothetical protein